LFKTQGFEQTGKNPTARNLHTSRSGNGRQRRHAQFLPDGKIIGIRKVKTFGKIGIIKKENAEHPN
jgi:hypothetical protein